MHGTVRSAERPFAQHSAFRSATICTAQCGQVSGHMHGTMRSVERQLARQNATDWEARHSVLRDPTVFTAEGAGSLTGRSGRFQGAVRSEARRGSHRYYDSVPLIPCDQRKAPDAIIRSVSWPSLRRGRVPVSWRTGAELVLHTENEADMAEALDSGSRGVRSIPKLKGERTAGFEILNYGCGCGRDGC